MLRPGAAGKSRVRGGQRVQERRRSALAQTNLMEKMMELATKVLDKN